MLGTNHFIPISFSINSGEKEIIDNDWRVILRRMIRLKGQSLE
jgi:hypothetical protein